MKHNLFLEKLESNQLKELKRKRKVLISEKQLQLQRYNSDLQFKKIRPKDLIKDCYVFTPTKVHNKFYFKPLKI